MFCCTKNMYIVNIHKFTDYFKCIISGFKYIYNVGQPLPLSVSTTFSSSQTETVPIQQQLPYHLFTSAPITSNLLFFCIYLLQIFLTSGIIIFVLLGLVYISQYNVFKFCPCCNIYQFHSLLRLNNIPLYVHTTFCISIFHQ